MEVMSQERFIRCKHCGLPHEAYRETCPVTGKTIRTAPRPAPGVGASRPEAAPVTRWTVDPPSREHPVEREDTPSVARFYGKLVDGKFRIDELIGKGGMGAVYRAEHTRLGKQVAIKVLMHGHAGGSAAEKRFLREARAAGSIGHPNIVEVFDLGKLDDGTPYLVMELLEGESLAERLRLVGAIPVGDLVWIARQILSALSAAHRKGIIHRDMKPENVFLCRRDGDPRETAKVLDFGISKNVANDDTLSLTMTGAVVGTPYYLSPEQARGDRDVDHRADIWSVGVLMYESLTGVMPFHADNYNALMIKILNDRPEAPSAIRPSIPAAVEAVVLKALASEADRRWQSAEEMLEALVEPAGVPQDAYPSQMTTDIDDLKRDDLPDVTVPGPSVSALHGPDADDPTEISDGFSHAALEVPKLDDSPEGS